MRTLHLNEIRNLRDLANLVEEGGVQLVSRERKSAPPEQSATYTTVPQPGLFQPATMAATGHPEVGRPKRTEPRVVIADPQEVLLHRIQLAFSRPLVTGSSGTFTIDTPNGPYLVVFTDPALLSAMAPNVPWMAVGPDVALRSVARGQFAGIIVDPDSEKMIELSRRQVFDLFG